MSKISIVIGTLGRTGLLKTTLEHLLSQDYRASDFEILIVTNGQKQELEPMVQSLRKKNAKVPLIRLVFCDFQWVAPKRNIGIRLAQHPVVAFIDDDCLAAHDWLKTIDAFLKKHPSAVGVEGQTQKESRGLFEHATENRTGGLFPTCNLAFRKEILFAINGFDESYTYHREDTDLAFKALAMGEIPFHPKMKVFHVTRATHWQSILKELRWVRGDIRLFKKFPGEYTKRFGFPAQGAVKQGALAWVLTTSAILGIRYSVWIPALALVIFILVKYWFVLRKKTWTISQALMFLILSFVRDLLFIPAFVFYALMISGKEQDSDNIGWNKANEFKPVVFS